MSIHQKIGIHQPYHLLDTRVTRSNFSPVRQDSNSKEILYLTNHYDGSMWEEVTDDFKRTVLKHYFEDNIRTLPTEDAIVLAKWVTWWVFPGGSYNEAIERFFNTNIDRLTQDDVGLLIDALRKTYIEVHWFVHMEQNLTYRSLEKTKERIMKLWNSRKQLGY